MYEYGVAGKPRLKLRRHGPVADVNEPKIHMIMNVDKEGVAVNSSCFQKASSSLTT